MDVAGRYRKNERVKCMFRIIYSLEEGTNWYRVKLQEISREILVHRDLLVREIGMNVRCEVGCKEVTIDRIIALGFGPALENYVLTHVQ